MLRETFARSAIVPNAFSVASARRDERESRESRCVGETMTLMIRDLSSDINMSEMSKADKDSITEHFFRKVKNNV